MVRSNWQEPLFKCPHRLCCVLPGGVRPLGQKGAHPGMFGGLWEMKLHSVLNAKPLNGKILPVREQKQSVQKRVLKIHLK